jgi:hypothetical protein
MRMTMLIHTCSGDKLTQYSGGGAQYKWVSVHVLVPLILGIILLISFGIWEIKGAKYPIFPSRLKKDPRILALTLVITAISGANFFGVLLFWPTQSYNMYGHDPVGVGLRALPLGLGILAGACVVLVLLSVLKGKNRELMIISSIMYVKPHPQLSREVLTFTS